MKIPKFIFIIGFLIFLSSGLVSSQPKISEVKALALRSPREITASLRAIASEKPALARLLTIGRSYGNREIVVLELAAESGNSGLPREARPAILVTANLEGLHFLGTEAACRLARRLVDGYTKDKTITTILEKRTIFIAPLLNPDAYEAWLTKAKWERMTNSRPVDEDNDGQWDEDGPEDLNGDGLITIMRVKDPEGTYFPDPKEPRLLKQADPKKGEKGIYKVYLEGLDNDGDGEINEDPPGGVEVNRNFPHDFEYFVKTRGGWPVSEPETQALLKFMTEHQSIALVLNFSTENTILNLQQSGQARVGADKVRLPRMYASVLGLESDQEYTLKEIVEAMRGLGMAPGVEITEEMVASFLGFGPAVTIDRLDMPIFEAIQKEYKELVSKAGLDYPERRAKAVEKGSFVAYCYFQYGVPVFSTDIWSVPEPKKPAEKDILTPEKLKTMTSEEFIALGEDKIDAFLKAQNAPATFSAASVIAMVKSGQITPARMAELLEKMPPRPPASDEEHPEAYLLRWSDTTLAGSGFVNWTPFKHPTLGEVEIGGLVPGIKLLPPDDLAQKAIETHLDFYLKLIERVAEVKIQEIRAKRLGEGVYEVNAYLTNPNWFPTSTAQGRRAMSSWPIRVKLVLEKDQQLFSGRSTVTVPFINGGEVKKVVWTIRGKKGTRITVEVVSPKAGRASSTLILP